MIREVADRDSMVGHDLMSACIFRDQTVRVRFYPDLRGPRVPLAFTPWVIAPGLLQPPQVVHGSWVGHSLTTGPFRIIFDEVPAPLPLPVPHTRWGLSGQARRTFP